MQHSQNFHRQSTGMNSQYMSRKTIQKVRRPSPVRQVDAKSSDLETIKTKPWKRKRKVNARLRAFRLRCARRKYKQLGIYLEEE